MASSIGSNKVHVNPIERWRCIHSDCKLLCDPSKSHWGDNWENLARSLISFNHLQTSFTTHLVYASSPPMCPPRYIVPVVTLNLRYWKWVPVLSIIYSFVVIVDLVGLGKYPLPEASSHNKVLYFRMCSKLSPIAVLSTHHGCIHCLTFDCKYYVRFNIPTTYNIILRGSPWLTPSLLCRIVILPSSSRNASGNYWL